MSLHEQPKRTLKNGLSMLLGEENQVQLDGNKQLVTEEVLDIPLHMLRPGKFQPRQTFGQESLEELSISIASHGILQPIIVRPLNYNSNTYEIIAGERRYKAAKIAGLQNVPVVVKPISDEAAWRFALIENIQRQDLNPIEEAQGYKKLIELFSYTQDDLANMLGKSRSHISNLVRLLTLPVSVQQLVLENKLSVGHARTLINVENAEERAQELANKKVNVRQAENLKKRNKTGPNQNDKEVDDLKQLEEVFFDLLKLPVKINCNGVSGTMVINFKNLKELDSLIQQLLEVKKE